MIETETGGEIWKLSDSCVNHRQKWNDLICYAVKQYIIPLTVGQRMNMENC